MKYLQGRKGFALRVAEREKRMPDTNEVLVRVEACGICGTDLHFLRRNEAWTPLGHEIAAVVEEIGPGVTHTKPGDRVIVEDHSFCGVCEECKKGLFDRCTQMTDLGDQSGMGEWMTVPSNNIVPYEGLSVKEASLVEPSVVAYTAVTRSGLADGDTAVVWGLGPIGLFCIPVLRHFGASKVIAIGSRSGSVRNEARAALARELGADEIYYSKETSIADVLPEDARTVIVTSPPSTVAEAVLTAPMYATIVPLGICLSEDRFASIDVDDIIFQKKKIIPVITEPAMHFPDCIRLIRDGVIPAEKFITHEVPLADIDTFRALFTEDRPVIKAIVTP